MGYLLRPGSDGFPPARLAGRTLIAPSGCQRLKRLNPRAGFCRPPFLQFQAEPGIASSLHARSARMRSHFTMKIKLTFLALLASAATAFPAEYTRFRVCQDQR